MSLSWYDSQQHSLCVVWIGIIKVHQNLTRIKLKIFCFDILFQVFNYTTLSINVFNNKTFYQWLIIKGCSKLACLSLEATYTLACHLRAEQSMVP